MHKNEFYKGEIIAMAGASVAHSQIIANCIVELGSYLKGKKCKIFPSDLRIHSLVNSLYTYPDLSIICNEIQTTAKRKNTITNPTVLIEVLSKSTQDYDRGAKFELYRNIESLKEYILISRIETLVEKYEKQSDGSWVLHEYKTENDSFTISSIQLLVSVKDLYRDVDFAVEED